MLRSPRARAANLTMVKDGWKPGRVCVCGEATRLLLKGLLKAVAFGVLGVRALVYRSWKKHTLEFQKPMVINGPDLFLFFKRRPVFCWVIRDFAATGGGGGAGG